MDELISTRSVIETGGLEQLARRMAEDPNIYEQLNEINAQLRSTKSMEDWIQRDMKFHCSLVSSTGLNALAAFNELLQIFFQHFREDFPRADWNDGVAEHQQIIDALRDGDSDCDASDCASESFCQDPLANATCDATFAGCTEADFANNDYTFYLLLSAL